MDYGTSSAYDIDRQADDRSHAAVMKAMMGCGQSAISGTAEGLLKSTSIDLENTSDASSDCDCEDCVAEQSANNAVPSGNIYGSGESTEMTHTPMSATHKNAPCVVYIPHLQTHGVLAPAMACHDVKNEEHECSMFEKYRKCADFTKCSIEGWTTEDMNKVKKILLWLLIINLIVTFAINPFYLHIFYFLSYWGVLAALLSTWFQLKACENPETYQTAAMITQEMSWSFNLIIFPFFWLFIFKWELEQTDLSTPLGKIYLVHYFTTHTWPFISCVVNTYLTKDMTVVVSDWKIMLASGVIYIYANWLGTIEEGMPMYPIADWTNYPETIFLYFALGCLQTLAYYLFAVWLNE